MNVTNNDVRKVMCSPLFSVRFPTVVDSTGNTEKEAERTAGCNFGHRDGSMFLNRNSDNKTRWSFFCATCAST